MKTIFVTRVQPVEQPVLMDIGEDLCHQAASTRVSEIIVPLSMVMILSAQ